MWPPSRVELGSSNARGIKRGNEALGDGAALLPPHALESEVISMAEHGLVLIVGNGASEVAASGATCLVGCVLVHHGKVDVIAAEVPDAIEDGTGVIDMPWEDEMTHDDAASHGPIVRTRRTTGGA